MAVVCRPQAAEQVQAFDLHAVTSRLPEAENEVAHEEHAEQTKQNFPDIFQCFHVFGILVIIFSVV